MVEPGGVRLVHPLFVIPSPPFVIPEGNLRFVVPIRFYPLGGLMECVINSDIPIKHGCPISTRAFAGRGGIDTARITVLLHDALH